MYFGSEEKGKNLFQLYYEEKKGLKPFEALVRLEEPLLWEGLHSFKDLFEEELQQDISLIEIFLEFLQAVQSRNKAHYFNFEVMQKIKSYLDEGEKKHSVKDFFSLVKDKDLFYENLQFLSVNHKEPFNIPLEWFQSELSERFFNIEVIHQIGKDLLTSLVRVNNKEERETIFKQIFQKIKEKSLWSQEDIDSFEHGASVFGFGALFCYLGRYKDTHAALFQMSEIIQTYQFMKLSKRQFLSQLLFQVPKDKSVDYEGNDSYIRFNQCAKAFVEIKGEWKKLLEEEKEINETSFLKLKQLLLERDIGYQSFSGFEKLVQTVQMVQRKEVFKKINEFKKKEIGGERLYNYFSFLLFHPMLKNTEAVKEFLESPKQFLEINDTESFNFLHEAKKPSRYLEFPYIDLTAEELRNSLIFGQLDQISVFQPMKLEFYSYLDTQGLPIVFKKMKMEWEHWLLREGVFEIATPLSEAGNGNTAEKRLKTFLEEKEEVQTRIRPKWLLEQGVQLKEKYRGLEKELLDGKLPKSLEWGFRCWVVEEYQNNETFREKVKKFFGGKDLGTKYTAQILAKSDPLAMVTGNECPSCMAFGSGKNNVYLFNPNVGIFVLTKEILEESSPTGKRDRVIVQSVLTMDRRIPQNVNKLIVKLAQALEKKDSDNLDWVDFVGDDFLDKMSQETTIALDNREAAKNFITLTENGNNFHVWVDRLSTQFFQAYLQKNSKTPAERAINQEFAVVGLSYSQFLGNMEKIENYFLPQVPVSYSDKTGESVGKLPIFEPSSEVPVVVPTRQGVQKLTFEETLGVAFVRNTVYKNFLELNKHHEAELIAVEINEAVKGEKRKNLSRGYYDSKGKLLGYMIAYGGYDKAKKEEVIFVSDIAVLPEYQKQWGIGGKLLASFARDAAKLNLPVIANLRVAENGSYALIKKWSQNSGAKLEESEPYEIAPGVQAVDVRIPTLKPLEKILSFPEPAPQLESAI